MSKLPLNRVVNYIEVCKDNIEFFKKRIEIQNQPNYESWARSGGEWSERQYHQFDIEMEETKLKKAEDYLANMLKIGEWVGTDPDDDQFMFNDGVTDHKTGLVFMFRQHEDEQIIDLSKYTDEQKISVASSFGYRFSESTGKFYDAENKRVYNCIIAECIFETL